jgi:hypothetical protein
MAAEADMVPCRQATTEEDLMDDRKPVLASTRPRAETVAEKIDRHENEFRTAERQLGTELYENTARFTETVESERAERHAFFDRMQARVAATAAGLRARAETAIAGLKRG